jgi:phospholipase C
MMENRSFDHMLGHLKQFDDRIDGLTGAESNRDSDGEPVRVSFDARYSGDLEPDPSHDFEDVTLQLFGTMSPAPGQDADMSGFVLDYARQAHGNVPTSHRIMRCFGPDKLPALSTLAREFAVCNYWYSSVPGPTLPNRMFMHAGTSAGRLDLSPDFLARFQTVYHVLAAAGITSTIYYHDWTAALSFEQLLFTNQAQFFGDFNKFADDCNRGKLPAYCFLEPRYNGEDGGGGDYFPANDQHPDHDVSQGERLIRDVYLAIRKKPEIWNSSILAIVYDEHGGLYDHVPPPACVAPDAETCPAPPFAFDRLGVRVPAVIVSPYIPRNTVSDRVYDHTSAIATALKLFAPAVDPAVMGQRVANATPFDDLLTLDDARPNSDTPDLTHPIFDRPPTADAPTLAPLSGLQLAILQHAAHLESQLPADTQTGIDPAQIATEHDASAYIKQVAAAVHQQAAK